MMRFLRRRALLFAAVLAPLFAWGCGPEPTWRRFLRGIDHIENFPNSTEVLVRVWTNPDSTTALVLDASTGETKRSVKLAPTVRIPDALPGGRILAESAAGEPLVYGTDLSKPPRSFKLPDGAVEFIAAHGEDTGRWLKCKARMKNGDSADILATLIYDLRADSPPLVFRGVDGEIVDDGVHAALRESSLNFSGTYTPQKSIDWKCVNLCTGSEVWKSQLPDDCWPVQYVNGKRWILFRRNAPIAPGGWKFVALDIDSGTRAAEWDDSVQWISPFGTTASVDPSETFAEVNGKHGRFTIDLGPKGWRKAVHPDGRSESDERLVVDDDASLFPYGPLQFRQAVNWLVYRKNRRMWNIETGGQVDSIVQYSCWPDRIWSHGHLSDDCRFEIQKCGLFGIQWIQRVDWPASRNVPLRVLLGSLPACLLLARFIRRRRLESRPASSS